MRIIKREADQCYKVCTPLLFLYTIGIGGGLFLKTNNYLILIITILLSLWIIFSVGFSLKLKK